MLPVAVMAGAGWLFLFAVLLVVPPSSWPREGGGRGEGRSRQPHEGGGQGESGNRRPPDGSDVPPAVVSLLAGRLGTLGFGATLVDLAARGWFEVRGPAGPAGPGRRGDQRVPGGPDGPALCVVPALTALISIHGAPSAKAGHIVVEASLAGLLPVVEASLAGLLPVVEGRLRDPGRRIDFNQY